MKIMDILRKIGVVRAGTVSWKGDAAERPVEMIMDDVYDREKDLVHFGSRNVPPVAGDDAPPAARDSSRKGRLLHFAALALGIFVLLIMAASGYFGAWFWFNVIMWFAFTRYTKKTAQRQPYATGRMVGLLLPVILVSFLSLSAIPTDKAGPAATTALSPLQRVDLALDLENDLRLEDVRVDVLDGGTLEVRTRTPANVSPEAIYGATAFIFGYIEPRVPKDIRQLRLILTVNGLDALLLETARLNVVRRQAGTLSDNDFFSELKTVNLAVNSRWP